MRPGARYCSGGVITQQVGEASVHYLAPVAASVTRARRIAAEIAAPFLDARQFRSFELVVSEVVSNAVRHGGAPEDEIKFAVTPKDGYVCVQVTDNGPGLVPRPGVMGPQDDDGGFGLYIVERLTRRWGVTREADQTRVWFELDFSAAGE
jgi:anti-sigma regulatory factor (Ser/Thr protein kinase)